MEVGMLGCYKFKLVWCGSSQYRMVLCEYVMRDTEEYKNNVLWYTGLKWKRVGTLLESNPFTVAHRIISHNVTKFNMISRCLRNGLIDKSRLILDDVTVFHIRTSSMIDLLSIEHRDIVTMFPETRSMLLDVFSGDIRSGAALTDYLREKAGFI